MLQPDARRQSQSTGAAQRDWPSKYPTRRGGSPAGFSLAPLTVNTLPDNLLSPRDPVSAPSDAAEVGDQYLVFTLLEQEFALRAEHIQGVERLADVTPVPNVAAWISGVINLRGSIASVVDLRAFLGLERLPYNPRTRLLSVECNDMVICLVVDSVSDMVPIAEAAIIGVSRQNNVPYWIAPYALGSVFLGRRAIVLLDVARLLFSEKMQQYS